MAKIVRETQKIFGANAPLNQVTGFGSIKGGNPVYTSDIGDLQTDAFETGWSAAVEDDYAPYRQDRNAVDKVTTSQLAYQFQEGVAEWDSGTTYYQGGIVKVLDGNKFTMYRSLTDNNIGNNPSTNTTNWAVWTDNTFPYARITNCITEIPQDIKLELNNGTLTLKAGSKVYVPNGFESDGVTKKFDVIILNNDQTFFTGFNGMNVALFYGGHERMSLDRIFSGDTMPSTTFNDNIWYDTASNKIKTYKIASSSWIPFEGCSLPVGLATANTNGTGFTSIDQVFNGFGYIGSTVFALPGVKGLIPNGRNADGSLKNIELTTSKVLTKTLPSSNIASSGLWLSNTYLNGVFVRYGNVGAPGYVTIDEENNLNLGAGGQSYAAYVGNLGWSKTGITSFTPKTAFHAVDYQDVPKLATDNTFTGSNTFSNQAAFLKTPYNVIIRNNDIENGITPATNKYAGIEFRDKNDARLAWIGVKQGTDGTQYVDFQKQGSTTSFRVPTPPASDNSTQIATTAWVHNNKATIVGWGMPNYDASISISQDQLVAGYTAPKNGILNFSGWTGSEVTTTLTRINGQTLFICKQAGNINSSSQVILALNEGEKITISQKYSYQFNGGFFAPFKGVN